jgi:hypothetical protein
MSDFTEALETTRVFTSQEIGKLMEENGKRLRH